MSSIARPLYRITKQEFKGVLTEVMLYASFDSGTIILQCIQLCALNRHHQSCI